MTRHILSVSSLLLGIAVLLFSAFTIHIHYSLNDPPVFAGWSVEARLGIALGAVLVAAGSMTRRRN